MAYDAFMKIDGVDGESTDKKHAKWIEVSGFNHEVAQPSSGASATGGRTGGRAEFGPVSVEKTADKATPVLSQYCAMGEPIPKVEIEFCEAAGEKHTFLKYTLNNVLVESVSVTGSGDMSKPEETVNFSYGDIKWEYTPIGHDGKPGGTLDRGWSLEENAKL